MKNLKIIIFILTVFYYFCNNPFATRKPEPPSKERSTWLQPIYPERVIDNLKYSIQEGNLTNYKRCLTDSNSQFNFVPDDFVKTNYQGFFDNWNLSSEQNYMSNVFTATYDSLRRVTFTEKEVVMYSDSVMINVGYDLELHHNLSESYPSNATGQAEFWLTQSSGEWFITRWLDCGEGEQPSWSSIKVSFGK